MHFRHINVSWIKDDFAICWSKLKLTVSACRSPTCLTNTKASRRAVLRGRCCKSADSRGSNGGPWRAVRTIQSPDSPQELNYSFGFPYRLASQDSVIHCNGCHIQFEHGRVSPFSWRHTALGHVPSLVQFAWHMHRLQEAQVALCPQEKVHFVWSRNNRTTEEEDAIRPSILWKTLRGRKTTLNDAAEFSVSDSRLAESRTFPSKVIHWLGDRELLAKLILSPGCSMSEKIPVGTELVLRPGQY